MKARLILLLNINDIYFYYSLLIKTNAAAPSLGPPSRPHPFRSRLLHIVYVIWSGFNIIYYLLFFPIIIPSSHQSWGRRCHGDLVNTLCPWHLIFTHDGLRVQRTISLPYKDTSTCCFVKFISAASSLPFSLEANCQLPPVCRGNRVFCASRRESEGPTFFAEILSILCWECCWLLHPGLVWVIVPGRERRLVPAAALSQGLDE